MAHIFFDRTISQEIFSRKIYYVINNINIYRSRSILLYQICEIITSASIKIMNIVNNCRQ